MHTLVLLGSPRKKGNSETLAEAVIRGIEADGGTVELIRLAKLDIGPCIGCGNCEKEGRCIFDDDMQTLYRRVDESDCIVIVSPIYFYGVTAQTKLFIDRTQALWSRKYILREAPRRKSSFKRFGVFVSVAATKGKRVFDGADLTARYCFDAMDVNYGGKVVVPGIDHKGAMAKAEKELQRAEEFGRKLVRMSGFSSK